MDFHWGLNACSQVHTGGKPGKIHTAILRAMKPPTTTPISLHHPLLLLLSVSGEPAGATATNQPTGVVATFETKDQVLHNYPRVRSLWVSGRLENLKARVLVRSSAKTATAFLSASSAGGEGGKSDKEFA